MDPQPTPKCFYASPAKTAFRKLLKSPKANDPKILQNVLKNYWREMDTHAEEADKHVDHCAYCQKQRDKFRKGLI